jgi:glutaredoxin
MSLDISGPQIKFRQLSEESGIVARISLPECGACADPIIVAMPLQLIVCHTVVQMGANVKMKFIRFVLGRIILLADFLTRPRPLIRSQEEQTRVDMAISGMALYQFNACPFCVKVRRYLRKHSLSIELRDAKNNIDIKSELIREGGKHKVPCLRIESDTQNVQWLYSSDEICAFLDSELDRLKIV